MSLGKHHLLTLQQLYLLAENIKDKEGIDFESTAKSILEVLHSAVNFDAAWFIKVVPESFNIQNIFLYRFSQKGFSKYLDHYFAKAPIPTLSQIKNEGFISKKGSDLIEKEIWIEHPFYREVIKPLDLYSFLISACINRRQEYVGYMVFWRSSRRNDFTSQDSFFFEKASTLSADLINHNGTETGVVEKPEISILVNKRLNPGVIILDRDNQISFINAEGKNILDIIKSGNHHFLNKDDEEMFMKMLYMLKDCGKFGLFTCFGTTYSLRPILLEGNPFQEESLMFLIERVKTDQAASSGLHESFANFTAREGAVANLVGQGMTNKEIALKLGIGIHTVKDHIKNIMDKLKTHTRSGVVSKLMVK